MAGRIDPDALEGDPSVIYLLDRDWRFRLCNAAWDRFARQNGGGSLVRPAILGRKIFDAISGPVSEHYRRVFQQTLDSGRVWRQEYECSSPQVLRRFAMHIYPIDRELLIVNSLLVEATHERPAFPALHSRYLDANGFLVMCSNCRRTRSTSPEGRWDWVPEFLSSPPLLVSHGLCTPCLEYYSCML